MDDGAQFTIPLDFASHDGKTSINAKIWTSTAFGMDGNPGPKKPKAIVQIVHGMTEHIDRYDGFAKYLVSRGFIVCGDDHVGHGHSAASSQEYGHIPLHKGKEILIRDERTLYRITSGIFPGVPYVMYGHSMGSFIARAYIARYGSELSACVLSGTGNIAVALSKGGRALARAMAAVKDETYRSKLIDNLGAGAYGKRIRNARTPFDWLSTDDAVVDAYISDELCGFMFTLGGYSALLDLTAEVATPKCAQRVPKDLPVFFIAGEGDPVGEMGKGVRAAAKLLQDAGLRRVGVKVYPNMRHEIHNEIGYEQVYDDVVCWMEGALSESEASSQSDRT